MKTLTLKEAYGKCPPKLRPSPCLKSVETDDKLNLHLTVAQLNPCGSFTSEENKHNAALLTHTFNVLPELVEALEAARPFIDLSHKDGLAAYHAAGEVLNKANQVQIQ